MNGVRGFTLLEMVIAVAVLAVVATVAYASLNGMIRQHDQAAAQAARQAELQRMMTLLGADIVQLQPRSIRAGSHGDREAAMSAVPERPDIVAWTRGGWANPAAQRRSTLQRIAWRHDGAVLSRMYWTVLDRGPVLDPVVVPVLDGVDEVEWRFLDGAGDWHGFWPPANAPVEDPDALPHAVEIILRLEGGDTLSRLFDLNG